MMGWTKLWMEKTAILCKLPEYESYHDISPYIQITNGVRVCSFIKVNIQLMMYIRSFTCNHLIMNLSDLFTLGRHNPLFSKSATGHELWSNTTWSWEDASKPCMERYGSWPWYVWSTLLGECRTITNCFIVVHIFYIRTWFIRNQYSIFLKLRNWVLTHVPSV